MSITVSARTRAYLRKRVQDHMLASITLYRPATGSFNSTTGMVDIPSRSAYYTGSAAIKMLSSGNQVVIGESEISMADTVISIPFDSPKPKIDDVAVVVSNSPNPMLDGMAFVVINFTIGGLLGDTIKINCRSFDDNASWQNV